MPRKVDLTPRIRVADWCWRPGCGRPRSAATYVPLCCIDVRHPTRLDVRDRPVDWRNAGKLSHVRISIENAAFCVDHGMTHLDYSEKCSSEQE